MGISQYDPVARNRVPWNFVDRERRLRDRALFDMAIDSKLRGCDLVQLKIGDVVSGSEFRKRAAIR